MQQIERLKDLNVGEEKTFVLCLPGVRIFSDVFLLYPNPLGKNAAETS